MDYKIKVIRENTSLIKSGWIWKLAYKDARKNFSRLFLFVSSIVIGIAALVAIDSFNHNLQSDINGQARELLGADLAINSRGKTFEEKFTSGLDTISAEFAKDARFASMVFFTKSEGTRLIQVIDSSPWKPMRANSAPSRLRKMPGWTWSISVTRFACV